MSKGSKGGPAERWLGINRLEPPNTLDVPNTDLPMTITLGPYSLSLDAHSGQWRLADGLIQSLQQQVDSLQQQLRLAEKEKQNIASVGRLNPSAVAAASGSSSTGSITANGVQYDESVILELEHRQIELEKVNVQLLNENNQLKFKNKVLAAMCAIAEGDYRALCTEAGVENATHPSRLTRQTSNTSMASTLTANNTTSGLKVPSTLNRTQSTGSASFASTSEIKRPDETFMRTNTNTFGREADKTIKSPLRYQIAT